MLTQRASILEAKGDGAGARKAIEEAIAYAGTLPKAQQNPRTVQRLEARLKKMQDG